MERFMQQHRKTVEISPLILALALVSLLFTACGNEPTPTTVNIIASTTPASTVGAVQSPLVVTPPLTSLQKGKLKEVFPALANLENDVLAIEVEYDDSHYYTSQVFYKVERKNANFEGEALYRVDNYRKERQEALSSVGVSLTKAVSIPADVVVKHMRRIIEIGIEGGSYKGKLGTASSAGGLLITSLTIYTSNSKLYFTNTSLSFPNPFTPPWDGNYNGKTFFIEDAKELLFSIQALNNYTESGAILQDLHQQYLKKKIRLHSNQNHRSRTFKVRPGVLPE
jgi:hypothetical protein